MVTNKKEIILPQKRFLTKYDRTNITIETKSNLANRPKYLFNGKINSLFRTKTLAKTEIKEIPIEITIVEEASYPYFKAK